MKTEGGKPGQFMEVGREPRPKKGKVKNKIDWGFITQHVKPIEWFGSQRDLPDHLKRIVEKLYTQTQKFAYCPGCHEYEEQQYDPIESVQKFMDFMKEEYSKTNPEPLRGLGKKKKSTKSGKASKRPGMPDDSCSDITDLDCEEIMTKLIGEKTSAIELRKQQKGAARRRLLGEQGKRHICSTIHRI